MPCYGVVVVGSPRCGKDVGVLRKRRRSSECVGEERGGTFSR